MGYFHALKLAFLSSLIRKYMLWEGFYHDFSTKKVSASGGFAPWPPPRGSAPWTPTRGRCPLDPRGNFAPSNDLPWRRPCLIIDLLLIMHGSTFTPSLCLRVSVIWFVLSSSNITPSLMFGNALGGSGILQTLHWALCLDGSTLGGSGMRFNKYDTIHGKESGVGFQCLSKNKKKWGAKIKIKLEEVYGMTKENPVIIMNKWYRGYS